MSASSSTITAAAPIAADKKATPAASRAQKRKADDAEHTARMFAHSNCETTQGAISRLKSSPRPARAVTAVAGASSSDDLSFSSAETENARVDLFSVMVRGCSMAHLYRLLPVAWSESPEHTVQLVLHARDSRGGKGERAVAIDALMWLRQHKPATYLRNLTGFLAVGYFKDLLQIAARVQKERGQPLGGATRQVRVRSAEERHAKGKERASKKAKIAEEEIPATAEAAADTEDGEMVDIADATTSSLLSDTTVATASSSASPPRKTLTLPEIVELELLAEFLRHDWSMYQEHVARYGEDSLTPSARRVKGPKALPLADPKKQAARQAFQESIARGEPPRPRGTRKAAKAAAEHAKQRAEREAAAAAHEVEDESQLSSAAPKKRTGPPVKEPSPASTQAELVSKRVCDLIYSDYAGVSVIRRSGVSYDAHSNPEGSEFDLARDGVFVGYTIVIGQFYSDASFEHGIKAPIAALERKGFTVRRTQDQLQCAQWLDDPSTDAAWIISGADHPSPVWLSALNRFHASGKGIMMYGDNDPYFTHANAFLQQHQVVLAGNYVGSQHLTHGAATRKGQFGSHLIFTGVEKLYEGITICHVRTTNERIVPIATATDGQIAVSVYDPIPSKFNRLSEAEVAAGDGRGRIIIDCGFTKLYCNWSDAGTARYVVNATCWVMGAERGLKDAARVEQVRAKQGMHVDVGPQTDAQMSDEASAARPKEPAAEKAFASSSLLGSLISSIGSVFGGKPSSTAATVVEAEKAAESTSSKAEDAMEDVVEVVDTQKSSSSSSSSPTSLSPSASPTSLDLSANPSSNPSGPHSRHLQLSLAAKWAPSEGSSFDKQHHFASRLAQLLFPTATGSRMRAYRSMLGACRAYLGVTERLVCAHRFDEIQFEAVPAKCHWLLQRAFARHCPERYTDYKAKLTAGKAKINTAGLQPHEILTPYICGRASEVDPILEAQWKTLLQKLREKYMTPQPDAKTGVAHPGLGSAVAVVDVSGSMTQNNSIPLKVAISLGLLISSLASPPFRGRVLTFSAQPKWHLVPQLSESISVRDQVESLNRADWGCNTDFEAVFGLILETAVAARCTQADLPTSVFTVSDMRFDEACFGGRGRSGIADTFKRIRAKFAESGYRAPNLIFWNCAMQQADSATSIDDSQEGLAIVGGFSAELLKSFLQGEQVTPMDIMLGAIRDYQVDIDDSER